MSEQIKPQAAAAPPDPDTPPAERRGFAVFLRALMVAAMVLGALAAAFFAFVYWELSHLRF